MICLNQSLLHNKGEFISVKNTKGEVKMYPEAISYDIDKYSEAYDQAKGRINKKNIASIQKHIGEIRSNIRGGTITLDIGVEDSIIKTTPLFTSEYMYNLDDTDYIVLRPNETLVSIRLKELCDLMALEYSYRDFDISKEQIEEILKDESIVGPTEARGLFDLMKKISADTQGDFYGLVCGMQIGESPYLDKAVKARAINDYFMTTQFGDKKYSRVLNHSCMIATSYIMSYLISNVRNTGRTLVIPLICSADRVSYITRDKVANESLAILSAGISLQVFGRKVIVHPEVEVI